MYSSSIAGHLEQRRAEGEESLYSTKKRLVSTYQVLATVLGRPWEKSKREQATILTLKKFTI